MLPVPAEHLAGGLAGEGRPGGGRFLHPSRLIHHPDEPGGIREECTDAQGVTCGEGQSEHEQVS
ncbi:hypothetical protein ACN28I_22285 [Archangium gephyra]|uniref:hypothetical protein n=1 Tax=Archangium gephyra TaxID=48 RepID=UPI003B818E3C